MTKKKRPIEYTIKKGNSFKKRIDVYWKRRNEIRNESEFNAMKKWVTEKETNG